MIEYWFSLILGIMIFWCGIGIFIHHYIEDERAGWISALLVLGCAILVIIVSIYRIHI